MPDISSKKVISPIEGPVRPDYGAFRNHEPIGEKDTALSRLTGNYYDRAFIPAFSQANQRYYNQGLANSIGDFFAGLGVKTADGIPMLIGGITSLAATPLALSKDISFQDVFENNPFNILGKSISHAADEAFPLFQRQDFNDLTFMQQLSRPGELATANLDSLGFVAQSFLGGGLLGKIGLGAKLAGRFASASDLSPILTPLEGPNLAKTASLIDHIASNTMLTSTEAASEAKDAASQIQEKLHFDRTRGLNNYSDEEIKTKSDNAAFNVFWQNAITLAVTNGAFVKLLSPLFKPKALLTRANPFELELAKDGLAKGKTLSGFEKFLFDKGYGPGMLTKSVLEQALSEGLIEENLQYSIQKVNDTDHVKSSFWDSLKDYGANVIKEGLDFSDKDRVKSIGLGALLGSGSSVGAAAVGSAFKVDLGAFQEAKSYREQKEKLIQDLNSSYTNFVSSSIAKKTDPVNGRLYEQDGKFYHDVNGKVDEIQQSTYQAFQQQLQPDEQGRYTIPAKYVTDPEGRIVNDEVKAKDFAKQAKVQAELDDLIASELSKVNPDDLKLKLYQREKLNNLAKVAFAGGATDILLNKIDELSKIGPQGLAELGITDPTQVVNEVQGMKDHVKRLESLYKSFENSTIIGSNSAEAIKNNAARKDYLFSVGSRIVTLDDLVSNTRNKYDAKLLEIAPESEAIKNTVDKIAQTAVDSQELQDLFAQRERIMSLAPYLIEKGKLDEVQTKISKRLTAQSDLKDAEEFNKLASDPQVQELAAIKINENYLTKAREEAGKVFNKLIDPKNGYKNFLQHQKDQSLFTPYDRVKLPFLLHKDLTKKEYDFYEERKIKQLQYAQALAVSKHENYSEIINEFIKWANSRPNVDAETATSLVSLVSAIIDNRVRLYPEEAAKLGAFVSDMVTEVKQGLADLEDQADQLEFNLEYDQPNSPEEDAMVQQYDTLREIEKILSPIEDVDKILDNLDRLSTYQMPIATEDEIRQLAANQLTEPAQALVNMAITNGEFNDDFDDLDRVVIEEDLLKKYGEVLDEKVSEEPHIYSDPYNNVKDLLDLLDIIKQRVLKNRADKELKVREEMMMRLEGLTSMIDLSNDASLVVREFGPELTAKLRILAEQQPTHAYYVILDALSDLDLAEVLPDFKSSTLDALKALPIWQADSPFAKKLTEDEFKAFVESPVRGIQLVLSTIHSSEHMLGATNQDALSRYLRDYDIVNLKKGENTYVGTETSPSHLTMIRKMHMQALAYNDIKLSASNKSYRNLNTKYLEFVKEQKENKARGLQAVPPPSDAQFKAISELARFVLSPFNERNYVFDNTAAIKAPGGAGKTTVVYPILERVLGFAKENILVTSTTPASAELIAKQTNSPFGTTNFDKVLSILKDGTLPPTVSLLIIDEAGALSTRELQDLSSSLVAFNLSHPSQHVKMLMMYDSNQVTTGNMGIAAVDLNAYYEVPSNVAEYYNGDEATKEKYRRGLHQLPDGSYDARFGVAVPFPQNIFDVSPLLATYRSPLTEIIDLQNTFKTTSKVDSVSTSANVGPNTSMLGALGTLASKDAANLTSRLIASVNENANRTRMIVVGSVEKQTRYVSDLNSAGITDVKVLLPTEARGLKADEVYVDITEGDNQNYLEPVALNQALYTATSRAELFTYLANISTDKHTLDIGLPSKLSAVLGQRDVKYDSTIANLQERAKAFEVLGAAEEAAPVANPVEVPQNPASTTEEAEEVDPVVVQTPEESSEDSAADIPQDPTPPISIPVLPLGNTNSHTLRHPQSEAFDQRFSPINSGDEVYFAREVDGPLSRIKLFTKGPGPDLYRIVGILGESEVQEVSTKVGFELNSLPATKFQPDLTLDTTGRNIFRVAPGTTLQRIGESRIGQSSHDIVYVYGNTSHTFESSPDDPNGLKAYMRRFILQLYPDPDRSLSNYADVLDHPENYVKVIAYKKESERDKDFGKLPPEKRPSLNVPYLVVSGLRSVSGSVIAPQFDRLRPTILKRGTTAASKIGVQHIDEFLTFLNDFQSKLSKVKNLPGQYSQLGVGKPVTIANDIFYPFHAFVVALSNAYRQKLAGTPPATIELVKQKNAPIYAALPDLPYSTFSEEVYKQALALDVLMHDNAIGSPREKSRRTYSGLAQKAFSKIAKQNLIITLPNGKTKILRDYYVTEDREERQIEVSTGASLLGPIKFVREGGRSHNPTIKASLLKTLQKYADSLERRGEGESNRKKLIDSILASPNYAHIPPFTLDDLNQLFGPSATDANGRFSKISEGFGLRTPLPKDFSSDFYTDKNVNDLRLSDYVESNLERIVPTNITIEFGTEDTPITDFTPAIQIPNQDPRAVFYIKKYIRTHPGTTVSELQALLGDETLKEFTDSMGAKTLKEAIAKFEKNIQEELSYEQQSHSIYTAVSSLRRQQATTEMRERALTAIKQSHAVTDVGRNQGNYAARDFMRAAVYMEMLPNMDRSQMYDLLDFARQYYAGSPTQLLDLQYLLSAYGDVDPRDTLVSLHDAYTYAFGELGIPFQVNISNDAAASALALAEAVVTASSAYRQSERNQAAPISLEPSFLQWFEKLRTATANSDPEQVERATSGKRNKAHLERFLQLAGITEINDATLASDIEKVQEIVNVERNMLYTGTSAEIGDLVTEEEAQDLALQFNPPTALQAIKDFFTGKTTNTEILRFIDFNVRQQTLGADAWGQYKNGVTTIVRHSQGQVGSRVVRHEMFHKIFWEFMSTEERLRALDLARAQWGEADVVTQEERLAEAFSDFHTPNPNWLERLWAFFRNLWRLVGFTYNNMSSLERLFTSIQAGYYKGTTTNTPNVERSMLHIGTEFDTVDQFTFAKSALFEAFNQLYYKRTPSDRVVSYEEAVTGAFKMLENYNYSGVPVTEREFQRKALQTLVKNSKVRNAFIDYYFGAANVADAQRVARFKEKGAELNELKSEVERLQEIRDTNPENFTDEDEEALIDAELAQANIEDYIFDSELHDPEDSVTGRVKQRFVGIKYNKGKTEEYADFGSVYNMVINIFKQLPTSSLDETLKALLERLKPYSGVRAYKNIRTATGQHLLRVVQGIYNDYKGINFDFNPTNVVSFRKDVNSPLLYAIVSKDGSQALNVPYEVAISDPSRYGIYELTTDTTLQDLISAISKDTGLTQQVLSKTYYHFEDLNFLKSLLTAAASLRQAKPYVGIQEWYYGQYRTRYIANRASTIGKVLESRIITAFVSSVADRQYTLFSKDYLAEVSAANNSIDQQRTVITKFLSTFEISGLSKGVREASEDAIQRVYDAMQFAIPQMQENFVKYHLELDESEPGYMSPYDIIADQGRFTTALIDVLNESTSLIENASYIRGDSKKAFAFQEASWQSALLASMDETPGRKIHPHVSFTKTGKIEATDAFLSKNIFNVNTKFKSRITGFYDHDSIKTRNKDEFATYLRKEKTKDYHRRNFVHGFLDVLYSSGTDYLQFLPNPSNRRSIQGARVTALKMDDAAAAIKHIIKAQMERPDPTKGTRLGKIANYTKNWQKFKLGGLTGISTTTKESIDSLVKRVLEHNSREAEKLVDRFLAGETKPEVQIDARKLEFAMAYFNAVPNGYVPFARYIKELREAKKAGKDITAMEKARNAQLKEGITKVLKAFYLNHTINQYSLSQILYGDEAFFASKEDQTKRIQVATATGKILLVDEIHGLPPTSRVGILADVKLPVPTDLEFARTDSFGEMFKPTDAEGYMTPEFYARVASTAGIESDTDVVMKPVYYAIQNGIPVAIKYSVKVLTDQLVSKFPHLNAIREVMRDKNLDQATFPSAVKVGTPLATIKTDEYGKIDPDSFTEDAVVTIDNNYLRFQLNPAKEVDVTTLNPTQGTSVMNTNGKNEGETNQLLELNSLVIEMGLRQMTRDMRLTRKGSLTKKSLQQIRKALISNAEAIPGNRDLYYLLTHKDENGKHDVSLSLPLIADKVIANLASVFSKGTTSFRFPGSKLVLQADFGTQDFINDRGQTVREPLKFKDKDGYTEVYLPSAYRQFLKEGDTFFMGGKDGIVAFRIPSSNYHSLLALKVKGFYPSPPSSDSNVIIAPGPIVYYHGSDNDVDTLFLIKKSTWNKTESISEIVNKYYKVESSAFDLDESTFVGFSSGHQDTIEGVPLHYFLDNIIIKLTQEAEQMRKDVDNPSTPYATKSKLSKDLELMDREVKILTDVAMMSAKNAIVDLFSSNLRDEKNRTDLLTPISFNQVASLKSELGIPDEEKALLQDSLMETWAKLEAKKRGKEISEFPTKDEVNDLVYPEGELSDYNVQEQIKSNTDAGGIMVGIAANTLKSVAYAFSAEPIASIISSEGQIIPVKSAEMNALLKEKKASSVEQLVKYSNEWKVYERSVPTLKESYQVKFNGKVLNTFRRNSVDFQAENEILIHNGYPVNIFEVYDTIENLAIDNVKEQKLFILGITNSNANAFLSAIALGIPLTDISRIFKTPALNEIYLNRRVDKSYLFSSVNDIAAKLSEVYKNSKEDFENGLVTIVGAARATNIMRNISQALQRADLSEVIKDELLHNTSLRSEILDGIYTGDITGIAKDMSDMLAYHTAGRLSLLGEQLFKYAQSLSLLKRMPNAKWKMDQLNENILSLVEFAGEEAMRGQIFSEHKTNVRNYLAETSQEYKDLLAKDEKLARWFLNSKMQELENSPVFSALPERLAETSFVNRLLRKSVSRDMTVTKENVFRKNNILLLPHLYSAWRALNQLRTLIENAFPMHLPEVKKFAGDILNESSIFVLPFRYYKKVESVQKDFINYIASNMSVTIGSETIDLGVSPEFKYETSLGVFYGEEGWCQKFINDFAKLQNKYPDNVLLQSVEISTDSKSSLKKLFLVSDKVSNEETVERIRQDYRDLLYTEDGAVARDLFKYSLITKGMFFDRTSFALVFPMDWAAAYTQSLDSRLQGIVNKDNPAQTKYATIAIHDEFMFQFLRNNVNSLRYVSDRPVIRGYVKDKKGFNQEVYRGSDYVNGNTVYFDLMYQHSDTTVLPDFIKRFDNTVYAKMPTNTKHFTYYRAISKVTKHEFFYLTDPSLTSSLDLSRLLDPNKVVVPATAIEKGYIQITDELLPGTLVYVHDMSIPNPTKLQVYRVTKQNGIVNGYYSYSFSKQADYSLMDEQALRELREKAKPIDSAIGARVVTVSNAREAIEKARQQRNKGAMSIVRVDQTLESDNIIKLDIVSLDPDMEDTQIANYIDQVKRQISKIPSDTLLYTSTDLLDPLLDEFPDIAKIFATAIYNKTGFAFPVLREENLDSRLSERAQVLIKRRELLKAVFNTGVLLQENTSNPSPYKVSIRELADSKSFRRGKISTGDLLSIGQVNDHEVYGFVDYADTDYLYITPFSEDIFMLLQEERYDPVDFYTIVDNHIKC